jgi:hypothetical protein
MIKKNWFEINTDLLNGYKEIEVINPGNWDITSYLNLKYDINAALAFSKLYFPDFIEKNGCIILGFLFDEKIFNEWYEHFQGDITAVETMCNTYDIMDYFGLNQPVGQSLDIYNQVIDEFAKALKRSWEANCQLLFPDRSMTVDVYDEYDTTRITLFSKKNDN